MDFFRVISILQILCFFCDAVAARKFATGAQWPPFNKFAREHFGHKLEYENPDSYKIPEYFDAREKWPMCKSVINQLRDQGECGSCWAVSLASMLSDRICVASKGEKKIEISAEDILGCCDDCYVKKGACEGGYVTTAIQEWTERGFVSGGPANSYSGCKPYSDDTYIKGISPKCETECTNKDYTIPYNSDINKGNFWAHKDRQFVEKRNITDLKHIQIDIMNYGPILSYIAGTVFLEQFRGQGVFDFNSKEMPNHLVVIVGWGRKNSKPYWLFRNSWKDWGDNGFAKILRGSDTSRIESEFIAGYVDKPLGLKSEKSENREKFDRDHSLHLQPSVFLVCFMILLVYPILLF